MALEEIGPNFCSLRPTIQMHFPKQKNLTVKKEIFRQKRTHSNGIRRYNALNGALMLLIGRNREKREKERI